jgi:hypothetical protein
VDGLQPVVGQQPPDEPGLEHGAHSQVGRGLVAEACSPDGVLLGEARPADEAHSRVGQLPWDAAYSPGAALLP